MSALMVRSAFSKFIPIFRTLIHLELPVVGGIRCYRKGTAKPLYELYRRRLEAGPDRERHRSEWINWNYNAEIYSFGKRLGEDFNEQSLRTALVDKSYVEKETNRRQELSPGEENLAFNLDHNQTLSDAGMQVTSDYTKAFLRHSYPRLPEEGICCIHDYLLSDSVMAHIGRHLGLTDIVLCQDFPVLDATIKRALLAVIGCLAKDKNPERAYKFVQDFVVPQLVEKDISSIWTIVNPMGLLERILVKENKALPEPRLLRHCGRGTVMAAFQVGIYSDRQLVGQGFGETATIAEEEAARDALRRQFGIQPHQQLLPIESAVLVAVDTSRTNPTLSSLTVTRNQITS